MILRMYHISPRNYGQGYFVLAASKESALKYIQESKEYNSEQFKGYTVDNLPNNYTIKEYNVGEVVRHENA